MAFALGPRASSAGYRLAAFDQIGSTNTEALERARAGERGPIWFVTSEQTAGHGRRQRPWIAPRGNLAASILEVMDVAPAVAATIGFAAGLAEEAALEKVSLEAALRLGPDRPRYALKWPNDVLAGRDGAGGKLAGILVELAGEYQGPCAAVIGIGLNLRLTPALREQAGQPACDLAALAGGTPPDRNRVAAALIAALVEGLDEFERGGFAGFVEDYARHDLLRGVPLRLSGALGELDGIGAGVDARGALLLQSESGLRSIDSADVTVRRA